MESLNLKEICQDLLRKLNEINEGDTQELDRALNMVFPICLKCRQCVTSSCPHQRKSSATDVVAMLTIFIHTLDILLLEQEIKLKVELGFELSVCGKVVHKWKKNMELPDPAGNEECCEECCEVCGEPLPKDTQEESSLPNGHLKRQSRKEQCGTQSTVARPVAAHGVGQGKSLHTPDPMWPLPPWSQPPAPDALDRLQKAGMEPLPQVAFMGLGQCGLMQCLRRSWGRMNTRVLRNIRKTAWIRKQKNLGLSGPMAGERKMPFDISVLHHTMPIMV